MNNLFPLPLTTPRGVFDILDAIVARNYLNPNNRYLVLTLRIRRNEYAESHARCYLHSIPYNPTDTARELQTLGVNVYDAQQIETHAIRRAAEVVTSPEFIAAGEGT